MKIGVLRESKEMERRVALTPELVKQLIKKDFTIVIEESAGEASNFTDDDYRSAGATLASKQEVCKSDIILKVNAPDISEAEMMKAEAVSISLLSA